MTVKELIEELSTYNPESKVEYMFDFNKYKCPSPCDFTKDNIAWSGCKKEYDDTIVMLYFNKY